MAANDLLEKLTKIQSKDMLVYVERRLNEWAHWYSRGNALGLGYPPCSIEYRLLHEGIVRTAPFGERPVPVNESAEEIERLVQVLNRQKPPLAAALREYYFRGGTLREHARASGTSHTRLQRHVQQARHWLAGWLTAMAEYTRKKAVDKTLSKK